MTSYAMSRDIWRLSVITAGYVGRGNARRLDIQLDITQSLGPWACQRLGTARAVPGRRPDSAAPVAVDKVTGHGAAGVCRRAALCAGGSIVGTGDGRTGVPRIWLATTAVAPASPCTSGRRVGYGVVAERAGLNCINCVCVCVPPGSSSGSSAVQGLGR